jgi:peptidoglycan hydrolase-like protein with peptidoglycan-binding domain
MLRPPGPSFTIEATALLGWLIGVLAASPALAAPAGMASPPAAAAARDPEVADPPEVDEESYRDLVADAQRLLALRGFDPGPVDGRLGLRTRWAIRAYQATARSQGVLEALKGPAPDARDPAGLPGQPELTTIGRTPAGTSD